MTSYEEEREVLQKLFQEFGGTFELRAYEGTFRVSEFSSYFSQAYGPMLYTQIRNEDGSWADFIKGTPEELRREIQNHQKGEQI